MNLLENGVPLKAVGMTGWWNDFVSKKWGREVAALTSFIGEEFVYAGPIFLLNVAFHWYFSVMGFNDSLVGSYLLSFINLVVVLLSALIFGKHHPYLFIWLNGK